MGNVYMERNLIQLKKYGKNFEMKNYSLNKMTCGGNCIF